MSTRTRTQRLTPMGGRTWLLVALLVTLLTLAAVFAPSTQAADAPPALAGALAQAQIYDDDFTVEAGETVDEDVVVYSGDVKVEPGGRIDGNLTVYSGDIEIESGGSVGGSLTALNGDLAIDGSVGGSISAMSGDVDLGTSANVGGDISVVSGHIKQRAGAQVGGSILRGPNLAVPLAPALPALPGLLPLPGLAAPLPPMREVTLADRIFDWFRRGFLSLLMLGIAVGGAAAVGALRPQTVDDVQGALKRQPALSFGVGLVVNVLSAALIGLLYITVCFRPPAMLLWMGLVVLNIIGAAAFGEEVGRRVAGRFGAQWPLPARVAIGVLVIGAPLALVWWMGGCFTFFAYLGTLLLASFGLGALLVRTMKLEAPSAPVAGATPPAAPSTSTASAAPAAPVTEASAVPAASPEAPVAPAVEPAAAPEPEVRLAPVVNMEDDFTQLQGIGPKLSERLKEAGLRRFADVAGQSDEALAAALGWSVERVARAGLQNQAAALEVIER